MDNLSDLIYVNISKTNTTGKCPINTTSTPCVSCHEKCKLSFSNAFFQATCNTFNGGLQFSNVTTNSVSYLAFNENTYKVVALYLLTPSINTYASGTFCDFVIEASTEIGYLIIYIPVLVGGTTTIALPEDVIDTQSMASINLFSYMPSQMPFYYYNASYKGSNANYIIFPNTSCNMSISQTDYDKLCGATGCAATNPVKNPDNDYFTLVSSGSLSNPIYYNSTGANLSNGNDYYLDCQVADTEYTPDAQTASGSGKSIKSPGMPSGDFLFIIIAFIVVGCVVISFFALFKYVN